MMQITVKLMLKRMKVHSVFHCLFQVHHIGCNTMNLKLALIICSSIIVSANEIINAISAMNDTFFLDNGLCLCAAEIARRFFFRYQFIALILAYGAKENRCMMNENEQFQEILNQLIFYVGQFSCVGTVRDVNVEMEMACQNYILIIQNAKSFKENLDLIPGSRFEYSGRVIIIVKKNWMSKQDVVDNVHEIFKVCWDLRMTNVVAIADFNNVVSIFTFFPFYARNCKALRVIELDRWSGDSFEVNAELYPLKTTQMHGCPVVVTTVERYPHVIVERLDNGTILLDGMEGELIKLLSNLMNFSLEVIEPQDEYTWGRWNGTAWTGATGDLVYDRADIGIGAYIPSLRRVQVIDISYGYDTVYVVWTIRKVEKGKSAEKLLLPFKKYVWIMILTTILISMILMYILKNIMSNKTFQSKHIGLSFWEVTLGLSLKFMPSGRFVCYVFTVWMWTSMVLRNIYQGSLVGFLTHTYYEASINSMKDLIENGFSFYGTTQVVDMMKNVSDNDYVMEILSKLHVIYTEMEYDNITQLIVEGKIYGAIPHLKNRVPELNYKFQDKGMLRILRETYRSQIIAFAFPKFSPIINGVNQWIHRISEAGLIDKWMEDRTWPEVKLKNDPLVIQMYHVLGPFIILLIGEAIAVIVLLAEVIYIRYINKKESTAKFI
ncbi:glutamate receptor 1-like [Arctopsyche grandis]|uniref:glutamate receptor 1-like n=1 Tax=Arctopsyche grandis TaxID=121162 RepID=UPI00406D9426